MWDYLINAKESEILSLPIVVDHLDNTRLCEEAKHLIGFWFNDGSAQPKKSPSGRNYWSESVRNRIASQLKYIRHWCIIYGDYSDAPDVEATWFIDPPYQGQGKYYKHSSNDIDFDSLSNWVLNLQGQVIVCENHGADWLPFEFLEEINGGLNVDGRSKKSKEAVFEIDL
jgi:16S rRNA G966 N2-methylase RsmD